MGIPGVPEIELVSEVPPARFNPGGSAPVSYTHLRAHETVLDLVCRLLLEKKKKTIQYTISHNHTNMMKTYPNHTIENTT